MYYATRDCLPLLTVNDFTTCPTIFAAALAQAEADAATAKAEYDIVLTEMRDPDFIKEYGAEQLTQAKEAAKSQLNEATR
jgi:transaldolase